jgi:hypothetical protein
MATAKLYSIVPDAIPARTLTGQAAQVWTELANDTTPRLATAVDAKVGPLFKTRQDTLRVTLYYILVFKKLGLVQATAQPKVVAPTPEQLEETVAAS